GSSSARSPPATSPRRSGPPAARRSTSAASRCPRSTSSRPARSASSSIWATTPPPLWRSRSSPPDSPHGEAAGPGHHPERGGERGPRPLYVIRIGQLTRGVDPLWITCWYGPQMWYARSVEFTSRYPLRVTRHRGIGVYPPATGAATMPVTSGFGKYVRAYPPVFHSVTPIVPA